MKFHEDAFADVAVVAVGDGVDDGLADGHAHPMHGIVVQAGVARDMIGDDLYQIDHVERARELEANNRGSVSHGAKKYHPISWAMSSLLT